MPDLQLSIDVAAFRAFERAGWESHGRATNYAAAWGPITSRAVDWLLDAAGVRGDSRVLDLASGPGYVAAAASRRGAAATGVDIAESMVSLAQRLYPEVTFRRSEAERLPFPDASFDAVVGNFLINHLAAPEAAVAEAWRVLKRGGRAAFTVWDSPDQARFMGVLLEAVATVGAASPSDFPAGPPIFRFSDGGEFARLLTGAGLKQPEVRRLGYQHCFAGSDELWNCLVLASVRLGAVVLSQPPLTQQLIRQQFERNLQPYWSDDGLNLPVSVKLGVGVKP
jgi:SAM-dependent methyltransferase